MFFWPTFLLYGAGSLDEETMKKPLNVFPSIKPKLRTTKEMFLPHLYTVNKCLFKFQPMNEREMLFVLTDNLPRLLSRFVGFVGE